MRWTPRKLRFALNLYPPYLGAGVRVTRIDADWRELHVSMKLRWFNKNAVGTHFGGSLYSMVDPHLMLILRGALGDDYVVWDKSASIDYHMPGKGRVHAVIRITVDDLAEIRAYTAGGEPYRPEYGIQILGDAGELVATVRKTMHIRKRGQNPLSPGSAKTSPDPASAPSP